MSVQRPPDSQLNSVLPRLFEHLAGAPDGTVSLGPDDLPDVTVALLEYLVGCGLADVDEPAKSVICAGCEQACPMPITFRQRPSDQSDHSFVACDKRTDIGLIPLAPVRLRRWRLSIEHVARVLAALLKTDGKPAHIPGRRSWRLGEVAAGSSRIPATLAPITEEAAHEFGLNSFFMDRTVRRPCLACVSIRCSSFGMAAWEFEWKPCKTRSRVGWVILASRVKSALNVAMSFYSTTSLRAAVCFLIQTLILRTKTYFSISTTVPDKPFRSINCARPSELER